MATFKCSVCGAAVDLIPGEANALCSICGQQYSVGKNEEGKTKVTKINLTESSSESADELNFGNEFVSDYIPETPDTNLPPEIPEKKKKKKKKGGNVTGLIIGVILLFALGMGGFLLWQGGFFDSANGESPLSGLTSLLGGATATPTATATLPPTPTALPTATPLPATPTELPTIAQPTTIPSPTQIPLEKIDVVGVMGSPIKSIDNYFGGNTGTAVAALKDEIPLFNNQAGVAYQTKNWKATVVNRSGKASGLIFEPSQTIPASNYAQVFIAFNLLVDQQPTISEGRMLWVDVHGYDIDLLSDFDNITAIKIRRHQTGSTANTPVPATLPPQVNTATALPAAPAQPVAPQPLNNTPTSS